MTKRKHTGLRLTIRWVPGHEGVVGNKEADRLAKMAVEKGSSRRNELPAPLRKGIPRSKAAAWRVNKAKLAQRATKAWTESPRYAKLRYVVGRMPSKHFLGLTAELPRKKASLLFQLRSGHIPLRAHLHRITQADSPNCGQCNGSRETVHHFLMMCPKYAEARRTMATEGGRSMLQMSKLLNSAKLLPHLLSSWHTLADSLKHWVTLTLYNDSSAGTPEGPRRDLGDEEEGEGEVGSRRDI
jgi:hypothetical protein